MSASIMPGISAGGTRASSMILIPSRTPIRCYPFTRRRRRAAGGPRARSLEVAGESRGQQADVGNLVEARDLLGDALGLATIDGRDGAREELVAERLIGERVIGMAGRAPRGPGQHPAVRQTHGEPAPGVLLEPLAEALLDHHLHAFHESTHRRVAHVTVLERGEVYAPL